jgi:hypothetical protein
MESFLWLGQAQRIPVYAFFLGDKLQVWWSGRGAAAERAIHEALAGRPFAALADDEKKRLGQQFEEGYRSQFRRRNLEEILTLLAAFFHLPAGS